MHTGGMRPPAGIVLAALAACPACLPYSAAVGQTAAPISRGGIEAGVSTGIGYQRVTEENPDPAQPDDSTTMLALPKLEANILYGVSEALGFNLHVSDAGLQPGVKISAATTGKVQVAFLPAIAFGMQRSSGEGDKATLTSLLLGGRLLASSPNSAYGAIGYDFQRIDQEQTAATDPTSSDSSTMTIHNLTAAVGYDLPLGDARLRPELAVVYAPKASTDDDDPMSQDAEWDRLALFVNFTIAVATPSPR